MVKHLTTADFEQILNEKKGYYVIDFWASWCGPCRMLAPIFEELSEEMPDVEFCKVNVDEEQEIALKLRVASIPTILYVQNGVIVNKTVGYMEKEELKTNISENMLK